MVVKIFTNPTNYSIQKIYKKDAQEILIGVENGAYYALENGLTLDLVIGDFDSIDATHKEYVIKRAKKVVEHPIKKDYTDTYLAVKEALNYNPDEIIIYGGIGERFDHSYANILLLKLGRVSLVNDTHKIYVLDPDHYIIKNAYKTISFFALEDVIGLTLSGFLYDLDNYDLAIDDPLCISNEGSGKVTFKEGLLLVVESTGK